MMHVYESELCFIGFYDSLGVSSWCQVTVIAMWYKDIL